MKDILKAHISSISKDKWNKRRIVNALAIFRLRKNRGGIYFAEIIGLLNQGSLFLTPILLLNQYFGLGIQFVVIAVAVVVIGFYIGSYVLGFYDEHDFKLWQTELEMESIRYNPYFQRIEKKLDDLLCEKKKRDR